MIKSASRSSITNDQKYRSMSAGTVPSSEYLIETRVLDTAVPSVTFDNLSQYAGIYKHLQICLIARIDNVNTARWKLMTFNGVGGTSYSSHGLVGNGSTIVSQNEISASSMKIGFTDGAQFTAAIIDILDPFNTSKNTTVRSLVGASGFAKEIQLRSGLFISTASISSITITAAVENFVAGSRFSLYGVTA